MRLALFLGAGFSRAFGLPVMTEFFQYAKESTSVSEEQKEFLRSLQRESQRAQGIIQGNDENLEHVWSLASMSNFGTARRTYTTLREIFRLVYRRPPTIPEPEKLLRPFRRLLGIGEDPGAPDYRSKNQLTVITTNYDVLVDYVLSACNMKASLPVQWQSAPAKRARPILYSGKASAPLLCKLHGSVNWYRKGRSRSVVVEDGLAELRVEYPDKKLPWPFVGADNYAPIGPPLIVPPTFFKERSDTILDPVWDAARKALASASHLTFVGYSFPETDQHMRYFLAGALAGHVDLRRVDVVDPNAEEIVRRLRNPQDGFQQALTSKLRAFPGQWETNGYSVTSE